MWCTDECNCHFYFLCPTQNPYVYIWCGFTFFGVWRFPNSPIVCVVLALDSWDYCSGEQAQQPNIHKISQSSLYSWTMYINKRNKVLPPYANSPCHKVAHAGNSTSSFSISAILHSCILGYSCFLSANILIISWHPSIIFVGLCWFVSIGMHLGIF